MVPLKLRHGFNLPLQLPNPLSMKHRQKRLASCGCGLPRPLFSHPPRHAGSSTRKGKGQTELDKRSKQYFFMLLSAARKRDERLLASAMKSLGADKEYLDHMRSADPEFAGSLNVQDVLLKAASRCGQPTLADRLFTVRKWDRLGSVL